MSKNSSTPLPKGSVLAFQSSTCNTEGEECESTDISARQITGADLFVAVNSLALKKLKYPRQQAAQSRRAVNRSSRMPADHILPRPRRMSCYWEAQTAGGPHMRPFNTSYYIILGVAIVHVGDSQKPASIWRKRTAARYNDTDWGANPLAAKKAVKRHKVFSVRGVRLYCLQNLTTVCHIHPASSLSQSTVEELLGHLLQCVDVMGPAFAHPCWAALGRLGSYEENENKSASLRMDPLVGVLPSSWLSMHLESSHPMVLGAPNVGLLDSQQQ